MSDPFAPPKERRREIRPERLKRPPARPTGPRVFSTAKRTIHTGGPGTAPPDFVGPTTSQDEWYFYWAAKRVLDPDQDPRQPPFHGGRLWEFQSPELGGFSRSLGSAVVDFLFKISNPFLVVRIQTYRFHTAADANQQFHDRTQLANLSRQFDVRDVYSEDFIGDRTGQAAIVVVKEVLGLIRRSDPLASHSAMFLRPGRL